MEVPNPPSVRWPVATRGQHQHARGSLAAVNEVSRTRETTTTQSAGFHQCESPQKPQPKQPVPELRRSKPRSVLWATQTAQLKSLQEVLSKAKQATQVAPVGEHSIHRACQEALREIRFGVPTRARPVRGRRGKEPMFCCHVVTNKTVTSETRKRIWQEIM